ncbi:MAG TPA: hypothetical protein VIS94_14170 [Desulfomonilia bacterium]|jgi:hypothetical protein
MSETEMRKDIDALIAELKALRSELGIRYGFLKEDAVNGIKIVVLIIASIIGLKMAIKFLRILLSFLLKHKLGLAAISALCYLGWRGLKQEEGTV